METVVSATSFAARDVAGAGRAIKRPALATTYEGGDAAFLERVLPLVDYIEVTPDSIAESRRDGDVHGSPTLHAATLAELRSAAGWVGILVHGVGLSIGSHDGYSRQYLSILDQVFRELPVAWHSEHLAYTNVDGRNLGTMLALPKTGAVLDMVCDRVNEIQDRYGVPFLMENVVHILPDYPGDFGEAEFLNRLTARTGCGLILDVYNLECDARNYGCCPDAFLSELDLSRVREMHLAGGVEHKGFQLDIHSRLTADSTVDLARRAIDAAAGSIRVVTYELLREAVPVLGHDAIAGELRRLSALLCGRALEPAAATAAVN